VGSSILIAPSGLAAAAKQDAWLAAALALAIGFPLVLVYNRMNDRLSSASFVQLCRELLGRWLGSAIAFLYFGYFFLLAALVLRNIGDFMTTQVLPRTPIQYIHALFMLVLIMGIRKGLETYARTAEVFFPWVIFFFIVMFALLPPQFEFHRLFPIFGYGAKPVIRATIPMLGTPYWEIIVFWAIIPCIRASRKIGKAFATGVLIGGLLLVLISLLSILVLGADVTAMQLYPSYSLAKKISIGHFLERVEIIMAGIWFITIYFKLGICFYASTMTFAELFKLKDAKQLYLPLGLILIVLSILAYPDIAVFINYASKIDFFFSILFALIFPLLLLGAAAIRKRRGMR
jgi:spore germination protein KB